MKTRRYLVIGGILVLAAAVAIFLLLQPKGLQIYENLLANKKYDQARTGLVDELRSSPNWHEARSLLVQVELAAGQPLAALEQITLLWEVQWDTKELEDSLLSQILPKDADTIISYLEKKASYPQGGGLAVAIALKTCSPELVGKTLPWLQVVQPESNLASQAWALLVDEDPMLAWQIAGPVGYREKLTRKLYDKDVLVALIPQLLAADPSAPAQVLELARNLTRGGDGLELLLALEITGWIPDDIRNYSAIKFPLLLEAGGLEGTMFAYLDWRDAKNYVDSVGAERSARDVLRLQIVYEKSGLVPQDKELYGGLKLLLLNATNPVMVEPSFFSDLKKPDLLDVAEKWTKMFLFIEEPEDFQEPIINLLDFLAKDKLYRNQASLLKTFLQPALPPQPTYIFYLEERLEQDQLCFWQVSPDGHHVLYSGGESETTYWYDTAQKKHVGELPYLLLLGYWDPQSNLVAFLTGSTENKLLIYDSDTATKVAEFPNVDSDIIGWRDGQLYLVRRVKENYQVEALNPQSGKRQPVLTAPALPSLSPQGEIGYLVQKDGAVNIILGEKTMTFPLNLPGERGGRQFDLLQDWLPGDKGAVLFSQGQYSLLTFADGQLHPLPLNGLIPRPRAWLDDYRLICLYDTGWSVFPVVLLDIRNMSCTNTGLLYSEGWVLGNTVSYFLNGNLQIYVLK